MTTLELTSNPANARQMDRLARWTRVLCVLFFFSGFPALIYQLTWQRALFRIFGVNIESVTIVVTAFMLGLGLGSLAGGWLSKRRGIPLLPLLGGIELMTGTFGLLSLEIFDRVSAFTAGLPLPATAAVSLALVIVPTLLMGATLPVLVGHLVRRSGHVGSALGLLYYVNTLGAGAACLACAAFLFPFVGMQGAVYVAVAINAAVAAGAFAAYWRDRRDPTIVVADTPAASVARRPMLGLVPALALAGAGGFVSLSYEIFFFRTVSYATGSSATAFALTLGAFLIGLASGSRQAGRNCAALTPERAIRRAVTALMSASLLGLLFLPLLDHLVWLGSGIVGVAFLLVYLVARFWGSLLPYLAEFGVAADDQSRHAHGPALSRQYSGLGRGLDHHRIRVDGSSQPGRDRGGAGGGEPRLRRVDDRHAALAALGEASARKPCGGARFAGAGRNPALVGGCARRPAMEGRAECPLPR